LIIASCFDNGVKVLQSWGDASGVPSGHEIVALKKDGAPCYSVDLSYVDASASLGTIVYRDGAGAVMMTLYGGGSSLTASCADGVPVAIGSSGPCRDGLAALGGLTPAASCLNRTSGTCQF
jgi:hypothetical protein